MEGIIYTGVPSKEELAAAPGVPSRERMEKGRVACIECVQEIPCKSLHPAFSVFIHRFVSSAIIRSSYSMQTNLSY